MPQTRYNPGNRVPRKVNYNKFEKGISRETLKGITIDEQDIRSAEMRKNNPNGPFSKRWDRASGYKGFSVINIDYARLFDKDNALAIVFSVGDYKAVVELIDVLYWIQIVAGERQTMYDNAKVTAQVVAQAFTYALDGMSIKVDCSCPDFLYRFSYQATYYGYKYIGNALGDNDSMVGIKQQRPNVDKRANAENRGAVCKHLYAILANKNWVNQVVPRFMDWLNVNIRRVNYYLNLTGDEELTVPGKEGTELARQNALKARQNRVRTQDVDEEVPEENEKVIRPTVQGNNPSTNKYNKISDEISEGGEDNNEQ